MADRTNLLAAGLAGLSSVLDSSSEDEEQTLRVEDRPTSGRRAPQANAFQSTLSSAPKSCTTAACAEIQAHTVIHRSTDKLSLHAGNRGSASNSASSSASSPASSAGAAAMQPNANIAKSKAFQYDLEDDLLADFAPPNLSTSQRNHPNSGIPTPRAAKARPANSPVPLPPNPGIPVAHLAAGSGLANADTASTSHQSGGDLTSLRAEGPALASSGLPKQYPVTNHLKTKQLGQGYASFEVKAPLKLPMFDSDAESGSNSDNVSPSPQHKPPASSEVPNAKAVQLPSTCQLNQHADSSSLSVQTKLVRLKEDCNETADGPPSNAGKAACITSASQAPFISMEEQERQPAAQAASEAMDVIAMQQLKQVGSQLHQAALEPTLDMAAAAKAEDATTHTSGTFLTLSKTLGRSRTIAGIAVRGFNDTDLLPSDEDDLATTGYTPSFMHPPESSAKATLPLPTDPNAAMSASVARHDTIQQQGADPRKHSSSTSLPQSHARLNSVSKALPHTSFRKAGLIQGQSTLASKARPADAEPLGDAGFGMTADMFGSPSSSSDCRLADEVPVSRQPAVQLKPEPHRVLKDTQKAIPTKTTRQQGKQDNQGEPQSNLSTKAAPPHSIGVPAAAALAHTYRTVNNAEVAGSLHGNSPIHAVPIPSGAMGTLRAIQTPAEQIRLKDSKIAALQEQVSTLEAELARERGELAAKVAQALSNAAAQTQAETGRLQAEIMAARTATDAARARAAEREAVLQVCLTTVLFVSIF
jgi:hypothetical protein